MKEKIVETSIELTGEVAEKFMEGKVTNIDYEHLAFDKFTVLVPISLFLSEEQIRKDSINSLRQVTNSSTKMDKFIKDYSESNLAIKFSLVEGVPNFKVIDMLTLELFSFKVSDLAGLMLPVIGTNEFAKDAYSFAYCVRNIVAGVLDYMNNPSSIVSSKMELVGTREDKKKKRKGASSKNSKTYLYKTVYVINKAPESSTEAQKGIIIGKLKVGM